MGAEPDMKFPSRCIYCFLLLTVHLLIISSLSQGVAAQKPPDVGFDPKQTKKGVDPYFLRWRITLDSLAHEARTVFPEDRRPYAMVDVANVYWGIDNEESRSIYFSALDLSIALTKQDKKYQKLVDYVVSSATRKDRLLAKDINKRLADTKESTGRGNVSISTALDLLEADPELAATIAEAFAPNGLGDGTATFLIFSLAKKDPRLADEVYRVYLSRVSADEGIPVEQVMPLAGYAFGYSEYYSVDRTGQLAGASFLPIPNLNVDPAISAAFLNLAFRRLSSSIDRRNKAVGNDIEPLSFPILFGVNYLLPVLADIAPSMVPAWQQLQQQAIVGTSGEMNIQINKFVQQIGVARERTRKFKNNPQTPEEEAEASLENVDKVVGTCERDMIYSKAALTFASRKNFKRADEVSDKVQDLKQSENVKQIILIDKIEMAIKSGDFDQAQKDTGKVISDEHRALLYLQLAEALIPKAGTAAAAADVIDETTKLADKLASEQERAAIYFSLSARLVNTDRPQAQELLHKAVRSLNKIAADDQMKFSIPIRISLSCTGTDKWYGGTTTLPNSSVFEVIKLLAKQDPDDTTQFAEEIDDKITRIRSISIAADAALVGSRPGSKSN
jgi:hypothetical protein